MGDIDKELLTDRGKTAIYAVRRGNRCDTKDFLDYCRNKEKHYKTLIRLIERISAAGVPYNPTQFMKIRKNLYEIRIRDMRMFCFYKDGDLIITHGMAKKKDKEQTREISRAIRLRDRYLESI